MKTKPLFIVHEREDEPNVFCIADATKVIHKLTDNQLRLIITGPFSYFARRIAEIELKIRMEKVQGEPVKKHIAEIR